MSFWTYINCQKTFKKLKSKALEEHFTFCIHLTQIHCNQRLWTHWIAPIAFGISLILKHNLQNSLRPERMLAAKNMNATKQIIFWDKIDLKNKSQMRWLFNQVKEKPSVFLNTLQGTVQQLTENNESESVVFTLDNFMELEFKAWPCICEHEYLKLVNVTLFELIIDHNLIYHDSFGCQESINSGILLINLAVLKLFIDDRNSFAIEEWKKLGLQQSVK